MGFAFSTVVFIAWPTVSARAVAAGQVSPLEIVAQLLILTAGFGRFLPRGQTARKRISTTEPTSGNGLRRRRTDRPEPAGDGQSGPAF